MKNIKIPWWVKWFLLSALRWLIKQILRELAEGIKVRVDVEDKIYYVIIKIEENPSRSHAPLLLM